MSRAKKSGSAGLSLGTIGPSDSAAAASGPTLSRSVLGLSRINQVARIRASTARVAEVDEFERILTGLFADPIQAEAIRSLRTSDDQSFFTLQNKARFMDARALVRKYGFEYTLKFLQGLPNAEAILTESPLLESTRQQHQLEDELVVRKEDVTENEYTCGKCTGRRVARWIKQTRSADEAPTVFLRCTTCNNRWREG